MKKNHAKGKLARRKGKQGSSQKRKKIKIKLATKIKFQKINESKNNSTTRKTGSVVLREILSGLELAEKKLLSI